MTENPVILPPLVLSHPASLGVYARNPGFEPDKNKATNEDNNMGIKNKCTCCLFPQLGPDGLSPTWS